MKLETHLHTCYGSWCGQVSPSEIAPLYKEKGYDAIVVTDHYNEEIVNYFYDYSKARNPAANFFRGVNALKEASAGLKIFAGMEIALHSANGISEFIIYGFDEEFLYNNRKIYELNQKQLFSLCESEGFFMYQSHPMRQGILTGNPAYMHGAEVYNGHAQHENNNAKALAFAEKNNLIMMSGSDFHEFGNQARGGIIIPDEISDEKQLARFLLKNRPELIITN